MTQPLVSFIVPFYGVEAYIETCARSLMAQTYPHIEFIFIDDGSPDRSSEILEGVLKEFPERNAKILHEENCGASIARQTGVKAASGDYILYLDADDWIEPDAAELFVRKALETGSDLVLCAFWKEKKSGSKLRHEREYTLREKEIWMKRLYVDRAYGYVWIKMTSASLYKNFFFPKYSMHEDLIFTTQFIYRSTRFAYIDKPLVHYRRDNSSSVTHFSRNKRHIQSARNLLDFYVHGGPEAEVVKVDILLRGAWAAFWRDRSIFRDYPFLRDEALAVPFTPGRRIPLLEQIILKCFLATHKF